MRGLAYLLLVTVLIAGCGREQNHDDDDPSPGAMADTLTQEALETHTPEEAANRADFREAMEYATTQQLAALSIGEIMVELGERYMGRPYIVGPLDGFGEEVLVARLDRFDCFTFVEALMAMARGIVTGDTTYAGYLRRTEEQRYRDGRMEDYCSRLHYFTDWIHTNAGRGLLRDVTAEVGGRPFDKQFGFMTANREAYEALEDEAQFRCIGEVERELNATVQHFYVPQDEIRTVYQRLQPGDILSMSTHIDGLDVTHAGLAYPTDGGFGLLHASTDGGVKINHDLQEYVQSIGVQNGIIVARAVSE